MRPLLLTTLALATLLAPPKVAAQSQGEGVFRGVRFPEEVGSFLATRLTRFPDPALGISVSYLSDRLRSEASLYVYPLPGDVDDETFREQFDADWLVLKRYSERVRDVEVTVEEEGDFERSTRAVAEPEVQEFIVRTLAAVGQG